MGNAAAQIRAIALTTLQETLRRRVLYVVAVLVVVIGVIIASEVVILRMAREAGEVDVATSVRSGLISNMLGLWGTAAAFLAVFLGAIGLSSEITGKTIVNVLSRPVDRATYLTGRWAGVVIFLWAFQLFGMLLALVFARIFGAHFVPTLWVGFAEMFVDVLLLSGVSLALSVIMPPALAGSCAILLDMLPALVDGITRNSRWVLRLPAMAAYYLGPANMPDDLVAESFSKELLNPDYAVYFQVLAENMLYALAVFAVACAVFTRREIRFR